jgi:hypothetical protein
LKIRLVWNDEEMAKEIGGEFDWHKWRARDPTSAHWYNPEQFERLIAAHVKQDEDLGRESRTVREFIATLRGLTSTAKQKTVLDSVGASREPLATFFGDGKRVRCLLASCQDQTKPVKPDELGIIGKGHISSVLESFGAHEGSIHYRRIAGDSPLPWVAEIAFGWNSDSDCERTVITGVNFSPGISNPFRNLGDDVGLDGILSDQYVDPEEPVVFFLHLVHPAVEYTDRGKTAVVLDADCAGRIVDGINAVTKQWCKQRLAELRDCRRARNRLSKLIKQDKPMNFRAAAWSVMKAAYAKVSNNGKLPANARQIMYAARPEILRLTGQEELDDAYFTQQLLPDFINEHSEICDGWNVVYDDRGTLTEPHTDRSVGLGTLQVRAYIDQEPAEQPMFDEALPTAGPENRYGAILFVEKEGFDPLWQAVRLAERFDIAIMSTKGMSTTAARLLLDRLNSRVAKILVLHDFDISGFSIFGTLGTSGRRFQFEHDVTVVDIGFRLADVAGLQSEPVVNKKGKRQARAVTLERHGATAEEIEFLLGTDPAGDDDAIGFTGRRVELNAMASDQLVAFVESKLAEHGVEKVIPDDDTLERQARRLIRQRLIADEVARVSEAVAKRAAETELPEDLRERVEALLCASPAQSWDAVVADVLNRREPPHRPSRAALDVGK